MAESSKPILECMVAPDQSVTKHNYYTDKFDCTAWNDFDAIPVSELLIFNSGSSGRSLMTCNIYLFICSLQRSASQYSLGDHGGSRKRLMFTRRQISREDAQARMDDAEALKPKANTRRLKLITNIAAENS